MPKGNSHLRVVKDVHVAIAKLSRAFMECRDWGHSWRPYTVGVDQRSNTFEETLRCSRCYTRRHRLISGRTGSIVKTHYTYREGYLIPGWGRMSKDDKGELRLAVLRVMVETHGQEIVYIDEEAAVEDGA